jgi:3',5'-cyclic-AMP phosphodiesterase
VRPYLLVQLSDIHLTSSGIGPHGARTRDNLLAALREAAAAGLRPDVFLLTGDLADAGEGPCYDDLAAILADAARAPGASGAPEASVVYLPGNHDDRDEFRRRLVGGDDAVGGPSAPGAPVNQTHWHDGLRIIALDSTIPGEDGGALDDQTLRYLRSELATPAPDGTIVALHHPPIPSPVEPMARMALRDPRRLRDAIAGSDVRLVLCGHSHHEAFGMLGATPVWVSPAIAYRLDVTSTGAFHGVPGTAFSGIRLGGLDDGPVVTVYPVTTPA